MIVKKLKENKNISLIGLALVAYLIGFASEMLIAKAYSEITENPSSDFISSEQFKHLAMEKSSGNLRITGSDGTYLVIGGTVVHLESGSYVKDSLNNLMSIESGKGIGAKPVEIVKVASDPIRNIASNKISNDVQLKSEASSLSSLLKKRIEAANLDESYSSPEITVHKSTNETKSHPVEEKNNIQKDGLTVDLSKMTETSTHVFYGQSKIQKIGFDVNGGKLSPEMQLEQVKGLYKSVEDRADKWSVTYKAEDEKTSIMVFSDPTCGYCRKLHGDIEKLNNAGVTVRILFYPRSLLTGDSISVAKIVDSLKTAWCSKDPAVTLDNIYKGKPVSQSEDCSAPSEQGRANFPMYEHYLLGRVFDLYATPLTVAKNGKKIYGYSTLEKLLAQIL